MRGGLAWLLVLLAGAALAQERALLCYNYGCNAQVEVGYGPLQLEPVRTALLTAGDPQAEREILAAEVGRLYRWAGTRTPIQADRAGDLADEGADGRMDCIDHAASTTELLRMLERRGWLRFHRVVEPVRRTWLIFQHFSAAVEEQGDGAAGGPPAPRYVIDSWFVDHGEPAVVLPLVEWLDGGGPNVP
jgi:hypothetical protein